MKYAIITDHTVSKLYGHSVQKCIKGSFLFSFPPGEKYKTRETKQLLEDALMSAGFSQDTTLIGLGGGVVCDVTGFLASTYCRGVNLVLIPTTLMAMVDAAIGGKNGVNTPCGKNSVGTCYFPSKVLLEPKFLDTLPEDEKYNGYVEMLKHALIANEALLDLPINEASIFLSIEVKRRIVCQDPYDKGLRRILNFGHTFGHAIELLSDYTISHGKAVAMGILMESYLSYKLGILKKNSWEKIQTLFRYEPLPFDKKAILHALKGDKKSKEGKVRFVMLKKIGECEPFNGEYCFSPSLESLEETIDAYQDLCTRA